MFLMLLNKIIFSTRATHRFCNPLLESPPKKISPLICFPSIELPSKPSSARSLGSANSDITQQRKLLHQSAHKWMLSVEKCMIMKVVLHTSIKRKKVCFTIFIHRFFYLGQGINYAYIKSYTKQKNNGITYIIWKLKCEFNLQQSITIFY